VTLLPTLAIKPPVARSDSIHLLRFADATPSRRIAMVWRRSSAMGDFLARLSTVFKALPEALLSPLPAAEDWQAQAANEA
jgi:LysR family hydrogen peroxide-inducible transcriptional activator